jgi:uncharacterized protein (DUF983 family)
VAVPVRLHLRHVRPRGRQAGLTATALSRHLPAAARPYAAGLLGRCPRCGEGALFAGFLRVAPACGACGADLSTADPGDGPAVFVILIAGALASAGLLATELTLHPPAWVEGAVWLPAAALLSVLLLRPTKGLLLAAQFRPRTRRGG